MGITFLSQASGKIQSICASPFGSAPRFLLRSPAASSLRSAVACCFRPINLRPEPVLEDITRDLVYRNPVGEIPHCTYLVTTCMRPRLHRRASCAIYHPFITGSQRGSGGSVRYGQAL